MSIPSSRHFDIAQENASQSVNDGGVAYHERKPNLRESRLRLMGAVSVTPRHHTALYSLLQCNVKKYTDLPKLEPLTSYKSRCRTAIAGRQ